MGVVVCLRRVESSTSVTRRPAKGHLGLVEAHHGHDHIVGLAGLCFRQTHLRVFRLGEAADRTDLIAERHRRSAHGVGGRHEAVVCRLRNQHQAARDVPRREDVRRRRPEVGIDAYVATPIRLDACGPQDSARRCRRPSPLRRRRARPQRCPVCRPSKRPSARRAASIRTTRSIQSPRSPSCPTRGRRPRPRGHIVVLVCQDARSRLKKPDP